MNARRTTLACALFALLMGCATTAREQRDGQLLLSQGKTVEALATLQAGVANNPDNLEMRAFYIRQRELAVSQWLQQADEARRTGRLDDAARWFELARSIEPNSTRAADGVAAIERRRRHDQALDETARLISQNQWAAAEAQLRTILAEDSSLVTAQRQLKTVREALARTDATTAALKSSMQGPITLEFRDTPLRGVFEVIARTSGLNFVFDRDVRADQRVTLFVRNSPIEDVIALVLVTNQLSRKVLNDNSLLIYPNTPAKAREYQELVVRSFFLANADVKQAQSMLRTVIKTQNVYIDEKLNLVTVRDTADAVALAERLIQTIDVAEPEVMLEVEVLEVSRTRLQEIGLNFPTEISLESALPIPVETPPGRVDLGNAGLIATIANPALRLNLLSQTGDVNILANPRIRAKNREKARVLIGEKLPVFTSTAVPNAGVASSVSYIDVGLKLEVEPNVFLENEVGIKVTLEVSNNLERVIGPDGTTAFRLGTRSAQTNLRVRDGETQALAGLLNRNERETLSRLPGLGDLPGIGRLFSSNGLQRERTELVLLITPRIVRNLRPPEFETVALASGTDASAGIRPLSIRPTAPRALGLSSSGPATAARAPGASAAQGATPAAGAQPAAAGTAPAAQASVAINTPPNIALGRDFTVALEVSGVENAQSGEAVVGYSASALNVAGGSGGRLRVPLSAGQRPGTLIGAFNARVLDTSGGTSVVEVVEGAVRTADGAQIPLSPASATLRIGP